MTYNYLILFSFTTEQLRIQGFAQWQLGVAGISDQKANVLTTELSLPTPGNIYSNVRQ